MEALDELYQQVILQHSRHPQHYGLVEGGARAAGVNPSCGDEIEVSLKLGADGTITAVGFTGQGCAISQASASLMTGKVLGRTPEAALALVSLFQEVVTGTGEPDMDALGDLYLLKGVRRFPQRVKCAMLGWRALEQALARAAEPV